MAILPIPERLSDARRQEAYAQSYWRDERVTDWLAAHARAQPKRLAIIDGDRKVTWRELHELSVRFARHLVVLGVHPGDAVALQLPNWFEYLVCYCGIQLAGAVVVQPGADWRAVETEYALGFGPARVAIIPDRFSDHDYQSMIAALLPRRPDIEHVIVARGEPRDGFLSLDAMLATSTQSTGSANAVNVLNNADLDGLTADADSIVRLVFTSGTTGLPKAIMHTNNTVAHSARALMGAFGHTADDIIFQYVPLSTNYGVIMGLHLPMLAGATVVLMDRFSASGALATVEREGVTFVPGTPTGFIAFTNSKRAREHDLSKVRLMISAGSHFPVAAIRALRETFGVTFIESYGMNEFGMGFWCSPDDDVDVVDGSIGKPIIGLDARVASGTGGAAAVGETGELLIKSAGMCAGYFDNPDANAQSWDEDGWFHSGDLATLDEHGNYRIVGRSKDVIIRGGANVSPREVEEALSTHPAVREVSVIGLPDDYYGEIVCACVIPRQDQTLTLDEARAHLTNQLAGFKLPARLAIVERYPLNSMGKVQKAQLREQVLAAT